MAALNLLLVESKARDDAEDGQSWKAAAVTAVYRRKFAKATAFLQEQRFPLDAVKGLAEAQQAAERDDFATLATLAEPTATTLGEVFACIARLHRQPSIESELRVFGRNLGGFLYLWDALVDLAEDVRDGQFNAIVRTCSGRPDHAQLREAFDLRLGGLKNGLDSLALGPEGKLCQDLLVSLQRRLQEKLPAPVSSPLRSARGRLAKAGFVHKADCCEVDCCECGSCCDCNLCDCNPCNDNEHCCNVSCCDGLCCCSGGGSRSDGCCGSSHSSCFDILCLDTSCCGGSSSTYRYSSDSTSCGNGGLSKRLEKHRAARHLPAAMGGPTARSCPRCALAMVCLRVGEIEVDECRNCGGIWLDDKEIDWLAKLPSLPHNLLNRYPTLEASARHLPGDCHCPVCDDVSLAVVPYLGVDVDMCQRCHGFWLEHGVLARLLQAKRSPRRLFPAHKQEWRCPYCEKVASGGEDVCKHCGAPRPKTGFTGKLG